MKLLEKYQTNLSDKPLIYTGAYLQTGSPYIGKHRGIDFAPTIIDQWVIAPFDCIIDYVGFEELGAGQYVRVKYDNKYFYFFHLKLNSVVVLKGQQVKKGTRLAIIGTTGNSTGVHLHFEGRYTLDPKTHFDPTPYILDNFYPPTMETQLQKDLKYLQNFKTLFVTETNLRAWNEFRYNLRVLIQKYATNPKLSQDLKRLDGMCETFSKDYWDYATLDDKATALSDIEKLTDNLVSTYK